MPEKSYNLIHGDCLEKLKELEDNSVDSIVTDPPYGLSDHKPNDVTDCLAAWLAGEPYLSGKKGFMGKTWDSWVPGPEVWKECYRVLKPGGHIVAFAGSRTHDLMSIALRLAGFECRDTVMYLYGSGFPKSLDVSKALDGNLGKQSKRFNAAGIGASNGGSKFRSDHPEFKPYEPSTADAQKYKGWGTALKPAFEPALLFRKPLIGTVAENVLQHGTGALNIDGCRVELPDGEMPYSYPNGAGGLYSHEYQKSSSIAKTWNSFTTVTDNMPLNGSSLGRWPANLILDGSDEVLAGFPDTKSGKDRTSTPTASKSGFTGNGVRGDHCNYGDTGSAARFFYCAKASRKDRNEGLDDPGPQFKHGSTLRKIENTATTSNNHPCVKPSDLMRYICRLVTPPGGTVIDPFMGSGSTGKAAMLEGFNFIGIEREQEYIDIATARIDYALKQANNPKQATKKEKGTSESKSNDSDLFNDLFSIE